MHIYKSRNYNEALAKKNNRHHRLAIYKSRNYNEALATALKGAKDPNLQK